MTFWSIISGNVPKYQHQQFLAQEANLGQKNSLF